MEKDLIHPEECDCCICDDKEVHKLRNCSACCKHPVTFDSLPATCVRCGEILDD